VAGLATTLGSGAMTNAIGELLGAEVILIFGSNPTEAHPVIGAQIRQARKRGAKLIVVDPRVIDLAHEAEIHLKVKPGTNVALLNALMNVIITEDLLDKEYVENRTEGFDELWSVVKGYTPEKVGPICNLDPEDIKAVARLYASGDPASIVYCLGVTEHSTGTTGVMSIANLALLCGNVGKVSGGVNPLRGQNNVQGACDMGAMPTDFSGYQKVANPEVIAKFEKAWGVELSNKPGLTSPQVFDAIAEGDIRFLYIMGENPMITDPNLHFVEEMLKKVEFLVVQDIFLNETTELADVVLPATCFAEKEGTFTNTERRVQRIRKAVSAPGESRHDWEIVSQVMERLGFKNNFTSAKEVMDEVASLTPSYGGYSYERLDREQPQWPCPDKDHPGTPTLHVGKFARGERAIFKPSEYKPSAELPTEDFPLILSTGRMLYHYHSTTMTGRTEGIMNIAGEAYVEISPEDAIKAGIADGDRVKVSSPRGEIEATARVTEKLSKGVIYMPMHWPDGAVNWLTSSHVDPITHTPEYKVCAAKVAKA